MGYRGTTYRILFDKIGYSANNNFDGVPNSSLVSPSKNINLHNGGIEPRGGTAHVNTNALDSTPDINGLYDYRLLSGTRYIIATTGDGKIYKDADGTEVELSRWLTTDMFSDYMVYNNRLYITSYKSGYADIPQEWDGSALSTRGIGGPNACTAALAATPAAGNVENGTHSYKVTFYASGETCAGYKSNVVTVADKTVNGQIELSSIPIGPTGTTGRKIYRTVAGDTGNYKLLTTIADNSTVTYTDNTADAGLGANIPVTLNTFINVPTDWTSANQYPKQMIVHGYANSERIFCFGVKNKENFVYITPNNDGSSIPDFSQANIMTMYIETGSDAGLVGGVEFQDRIIAFSKQKAYVIDDQDVNTDLWGYVEAGWSGGAATHRLIVKTPNDIYCMMDDGEVYSVTAAQNYGDYKLASITRPHYMHIYVKDNLDLSKINQFHGIYDPKLRAIRFWVVRTGQTVCDTILTYYIDRQVWGPPEDNLTNPSGCKAACSALVKESTGDYNVWTGDYDGFIWKLNQSTKSDNALAFSSAARTPYLSFEGADDTGLSRKLKHFQSGRVIGVPKGNYTFSLQSIADGNDSTTETINQSNTTTTFSGSQIMDEPFDIGLSGKRLAFNISNSTAAYDYFVSGMDINFKALGEQDNLFVYPSGMAWTQTQLTRSATLPANQCIAWNESVFCVITYSDVVMTSSNGITWEESTMPSSANWQAIAWNGTVFCAIAYGTDKAATSTDGVTWTARTLPSSKNWTGIAWNGTVFCAVTTGGTKAATSPDGATWTARTLPVSGNWTSITAGGSTFCATALGGSSSCVSSDGITWSTGTMPNISSYGWHGIAWNGSIFCVVAIGTGAATSTDGITWVARTLPVYVSSWIGIASNGLYFCAVSSGGVGAIS